MQIVRLQPKNQNAFFRIISFGLPLWIIVFASRAHAYAFDEEGWNTQKSTHFIVYYKDADDSFLRQVIDKSEGYYSSIADSLGFTRYNFWLWDKRAKIYIYNNALDYQAATGKPAWSGGAAYYHEKVIETYPWASGFMDSLLPHELGHIIFREFIGPKGNAPSWLDEGVAMYQERLKRLGVKEKILKAAREKKLMPLVKLSELNIGLVSDKELVELYYAQAVGVVEYLISSFGRDDFVELCRALKEGKTFDQAINDAYRVFKNLEDLDKAWLKDVGGDG